MANPVAEYSDAAAHAHKKGESYLAFARRWARQNPTAALAVAEEIGSYPCSDPDLRALQQAFNELLGAPRRESTE